MRHSRITVIEGRHRFRAAQVRGRTHIDARYFEGKMTESRLPAVAPNVRHGRPLSFEERMAVARHHLTSHPDWADRSVAAIAGLSAKKAADIRRELLSDSAASGSGKRVGRDGRARPLDPSPAGELLMRNPGASPQHICWSSLFPTTRVRLRAK